jgi:hypothetical protein
MSNQQDVIVIGMPVDEGKREELAKVRAEIGHGHLKPIIYSDSVVMECWDCGMALYVGPRSRDLLHNDPTSMLLCVWCARTRAARAGGADVAHLGNPEDQRR